MSDIYALRAEVDTARIRFREAAMTSDIPKAEYDAAKDRFDAALRDYHTALGVVDPDFKQPA